MDEIQKPSKQPRKYKCSMCGEKFDKEELTTKSGKNYCNACLTKREEQKKSKPKSDWDLLFQYICKIYDIPVPTGFMFVQLKQYRNEYKYTDTGMYYTLKYCYEVLEKEPIEDAALSLIPYYYEKAKRHYNKVYDLQDIVENFENQEQKIHIKTQMTKMKKDKKKPLPLNIDWEAADEEE